MRPYKGFAKKITAMTAAMLALSFLLTGTYAYYANVRVENVFSASRHPGDTPPAVLHDDFDPATGQKAVYVENTGSPGSTLFVRVKLNEFLDLTTAQRPASIDENQWVSHVPKKNDGGHDFANCNNTNHIGERFHEYFQWQMGGQKWYMPAAKMLEEYAVFNKGSYVDDTTDYSVLAPEEREALGVKQTPESAIIFIEKYIGANEKEQQAFVGWIYDADGWAYWSQPLKGGQATGLLLSTVTANQGMLKDNDYCYIIDVIMDAVDKADLPMWTDNASSVDPKIAEKAGQASEAAKQALHIIQSIPVNEHRS